MEDHHVKLTGALITFEFTYSSHGRIRSCILKFRMASLLTYSNCLCFVPHLYYDHLTADNYVEGGREGERGRGKGRFKEEVHFTNHYSNFFFCRIPLSLSSPVELLYTYIPVNVVYSSCYMSVLFSYVHA